MGGRARDIQLNRNVKRLSVLMRFVLLCAAERLRWPIFWQEPDGQTPAVPRIDIVLPLNCGGWPTAPADDVQRRLRITLGCE
jgi:hypothetical protein